MTGRRRGRPTRSIVTGEKRLLLLGHFVGYRYENRTL
jgi:hypothetical protein